MTKQFPTFDFGDGVQRQIRARIKTTRKILEITEADDIHAAMSGKVFVQNLPDIAITFLGKEDRAHVTQEMVDDLDASQLEPLTAALTEALSKNYPEPDPAKNEQGSQSSE